MPTKPVFTQAQAEVLKASTKKLRKKYKNQEELALALGITQPSVSAIMLGTWVPGVSTAKQIALGLGTTLEELVGPYGHETGESNGVPAVAFSNLDVCLQFHAKTKTWSPWTIAAARAGIFGAEDFAPPDWPPHLDALEKHLDKFKEKKP